MGRLINKLVNGVVQGGGPSNLFPLLELGESQGRLILWHCFGEYYY